jgi:putative endopeptidase
MEQNFGSMGMLMAHEMTHGYDTKGSQFDQNRKLHEWWTKASR